VDKQKIKNSLNKKATWELKNIKKALSFLQLLNTEVENFKLKTVKQILNRRV